jgi:hypothetical protein
MGPTRPVVLQKDSLRISVWCYTTLHKTWMQTTAIKYEMVISYGSGYEDSDDKIPYFTKFPLWTLSTVLYLN